MAAFEGKTMCREIRKLEGETIEGLLTFFSLKNTKNVRGNSQKYFSLLVFDPYFHKSEK